MINIAQREQQSNIPEKIFSRAYRVASEVSPYSNARFAYPDFTEIYEEYVAASLEERINLTDADIDRELKQLKRLNLLSVEDGFQVSEYGVVSALELLDYLLSNRYVFYFKGALHNGPLTEVW